jgi:hypothetical protein
MHLSPELKSDQDGIEMILSGMKWKKRAQLKSDQDGIEIEENQLTTFTTKG